MERDGKVGSRAHVEKLSLETGESIHYNMAKRLVDEGVVLRWLLLSQKNKKKMLEERKVGSYWKMTGNRAATINFSRNKRLSQ